MSNQNFVSRHTILLSCALFMGSIPSLAYASGEEFDVRVDGWAHSGYSSESKCQEVVDAVFGGGKCYSIMGPRVEHEGDEVDVLLQRIIIPKLRRITYNSRRFWHM